MCDVQIKAPVISGRSSVLYLWIQFVIASSTTDV